MRLIDADELLEIFNDRYDKICERFGYDSGISGAIAGAIKLIRNQPTADVVSREVVNQIKWERDTAIQQLNELGYEFGERRKDEA